MTSQSPRFRTLQTRVPAEYHDTIQRIAEDQGLNRSEFIRDLLDGAISQAEAGIIPARSTDIEVLALGVFLMRTFLDGVPKEDVVQAMRAIRIQAHTLLQKGSAPDA